MDKIIHKSVKLYCDSKRAYAMFTDNALLASWLTELADVNPVIGGKYELFWTPEDKENNSTIGCRITSITPNQLIGFEWMGPVQFKHFMNDAMPLTHVTVSFYPETIAGRKVTSIHLVHTGWRETKEWESARQYFEKAWKGAFSKLEHLVNES